MAHFICTVCEYSYDEDAEGTPWDQLEEDYICPVCGSGKDFFEVLAAPGHEEVEEAIDEAVETAQGLRRTSDTLEIYMKDIHHMAETGQSIYEPMRTRLPTFSWDEILVKGAQLAKLPLNRDEEVETATVIGPGAKHPLHLDMPIYITHMSYGALSREAVLGLARGSAAVHTAVCSGEGGILPEARQASHRYIFEYVPNRYSVTEENLRDVDAIEIKMGQSAKPGMGGHLPGGKVTKEIAEIRGFAQGRDIVSPSRFADIRNPDDLRAKVAWLREVSGGKPIGIKFAAGNIEGDLAAVLHAEPDFITVDGRAGATGSAPKFVKASASVPTIFALYRVREFLNKHGAADISLVITGGLRVSSDIAKALAMGADAVAIGTTALMAIGCQQFRICNTGKCPMGIATQDPELRRRLDVDGAARQLANFLGASVRELKDFARLTGNPNVHDLSIADLCTTNSEISNYTEIPHV